MPELYKKSQVETALGQDGYVILQEIGGLTIYHTHVYPGNDLEIDWVRGECEWKDLQALLEFNGIDPQPIHDLLRE